MWETYLWILKRKGFEYDGFHLDIVTETYPALDDALRTIFGLCIYYKTHERSDYFHIALTRGEIAKIKSWANPNEWEAVRASVRYLARRIHKPRRSRWYK